MGFCKQTKTLMMSVQLVFSELTNVLFLQNLSNSTVFQSSSCSNETKFKTILFVTQKTQLLAAILS